MLGFRHCGGSPPGKGGTSPVSVGAHRLSQSASPADSIAAPLAVRPPRPRRGNAARLFGYDIFISFALGPPPRGTHSYASDLARRLRERDFTVFFSEDEAPPGEQLDGALRAALYRSKILVVIANRGTLADRPRAHRAQGRRVERGLQPRRRPRGLGQQ